MMDRNVFRWAIFFFHSRVPIGLPLVRTRLYCIPFIIAPWLRGNNGVNTSGVQPPAQSSIRCVALVFNSYFNAREQVQPHNNGLISAMSLVQNPTRQSFFFFFKSSNSLEAKAFATNLHQIMTQLRKRKCNLLIPPSVPLTDSTVSLFSSPESRTNPHTDGNLSSEFHAVS